MASLSDILTVMQNGVTAINRLAGRFPPITLLSTSAPATGPISYSSSLVTAFGSVLTSSGGVYRIALLPSS